MTRYLARRMKPDQKQSLGRTIPGRIGEFIITMDKEDFVVAEHWIDKAREQRAGLKDGTARIRQKRRMKTLRLAR
jgi:hypothetical protein